MHIVVTGLDGSGKTTLVTALSQRYDCKSIHLPSSIHVRELLETSGYGTQFDDSWTDRLIFALDNRISNYKIQELLSVNINLISQRGWMDSLIHGAVQGYSYEEIIQLNKFEDLVQPSASIYLTCDPAVAWSRTENDTYMDKYETEEYLVSQNYETLRFYDSAGKNELAMFNEPRLHIDTTDLTPSEVLDRSTKWLMSLQIN